MEALLCVDTDNRYRERETDPKRRERVDSGMKGKRKCFVGEFACNNYMGEVSLNVFIYIINLL